MGAIADSCFATLNAATCAAFIKESRMELVSATNTNRNPGIASNSIVAPASKERRGGCHSHYLPKILEKK
jgi:hypothetical protein